MTGLHRVLLPIALLLAAAAARPTRADADRRSEDAVRSVVDRHGPGLRRCFKRALRDRPDLARKLVVRFRVGRTGRASPVTFVPGRGTARHAGVERCVSRLFRRIRFPRQASATWFTSPLVFPAV